VSSSIDALVGSVDPPFTLNACWDRSRPSCRTRSVCFGRAVLGGGSRPGRKARDPTTPTSRRASSTSRPTRIALAQGRRDDGLAAAQRALEILEAAKLDPKEARELLQRLQADAG
jgi:hypothetical protein